MYEQNHSHYRHLFRFNFDILPILFNIFNADSRRKANHYNFTNGNKYSRQH